MCRPGNAHRACSGAARWPARRMMTDFKLMVEGMTAMGRLAGFALRRGSLVLSGILFATLGSVPVTAHAKACEDLASHGFEDGRVTSATTVPPGTFTPPGQTAAPVKYDVGVPRYDYLPRFCRITAAFSGDLEIEAWLPIEGWNREFLPISGGIYGGRINRHAQLAGALMTGAATATGNNGNNGAPGLSGAEFMRDHPEKIAAIGDALNRTVARSKQLITTYYGRGPSLTYMDDRAGRDPLLLIQRFPEALDAVAMTGMVANPTRHVTWQMWVHAATNGTPGAFLPASAYPMLHAAVMKRCDGLDGVIDGVLENPLACDFDPGVLLCTTGARDDCLTEQQVAAVLKIYSPVTDARTGEVLFAGLPRGSELEWFEMAGPKPYPFAEQFYRHLGFGDPAWDPKARLVNFGADNDLVNAAKNLPLNAIDPDIRKFLDRGGKLLLVAGWNDQRIAPGAVLDYYRAVRAKVGERRASGVRLFMVPGMLHYPLGGARATDYSIDTAGLLKGWARTGKAPDSLAAHRYVQGRVMGTRLVCAYPKVRVLQRAKVDGEEDRFACAAP